MHEDDYTKNDPLEAEEFEDEPSYRPKAGRKRGIWIKVLALLVILTFTSLILADFTNLFSSRFSFLEQNRELSEDEIVVRCRPAVVSVEAGLRRGTGFNTSPAGIIVTNEHVVAGSKLVMVQFGDGRRYYTDQIQVVQGADLAIVRLKDEVDGLPVVELDKKDGVKSGDTVTIIGNPLGLEKISQRGTVGSFHQPTGGQSRFFDINIPINPGNSGSPVINDRGKVVGIVYASTTVQVGGSPETRALAFPVQALPE